MQASMMEGTARTGIWQLACLSDYLVVCMCIHPSTSPDRHLSHNSSSVSLHLTSPLLTRQLGNIRHAPAMSRVVGYVALEAISVVPQLRRCTAAASGRHLQLQLQPGLRAQSGRCCCC